MSCSTARHITIDGQTLLVDSSGLWNLGSESRSTEGHIDEDTLANLIDGLADVKEVRQQDVAEEGRSIRSGRDHGTTARAQELWDDIEPSLQVAECLTYDADPMIAWEELLRRQASQQDYPFLSTYISMHDDTVKASESTGAHEIGSIESLLQRTRGEGWMAEFGSFRRPIVERFLEKY